MRRSDLNIAVHELTHYLGHHGALIEEMQVWVATGLGKTIGGIFPFVARTDKITTGGLAPELAKSRLKSDGLVAGAINNTGLAFVKEMTRIINDGKDSQTSEIETQAARKIGELTADFAIQLTRYYQDWEIGLAFMAALVRPAGSFIYAEAVANRFAELKKENSQPSYLFREEHRGWPADLLYYRYLLFAAEESCQGLRFNND